MWNDLAYMMQLGGAFFHFSHILLDYDIYNLQLMCYIARTHLASLVFVFTIFTEMVRPCLSKKRALEPEICSKLTSKR